jgi:hypothetical protein
VENRFQSSPFKCNLQRYNVDLALVSDSVQKLVTYVVLGVMVGLCTLNQVDP